MDKIYINADGGSRGNPGMAAIGIVISDASAKILEKHNEKIGISTNNVAEYTSLIRGLTLVSKYNASEVFVVMDSELVIRQINGEYKVKSLHLVPLFDAVKKLALNFKKITFSNVFREDSMQSIADALVNEALDER